MIPPPGFEPEAITVFHLSPLVVLGATSQAAGEFDIFDNIVASRGVVLAVLLVLALMSLVCWFIIIYKAMWFARLRSASKAFASMYWQENNPGELFKRLGGDGGSCPEERLFAAGFKELGKLSKQQGGAPLKHGFENVERAIFRAQTQEISRLETLLSFLATTGSAAPFIGLFGTVWGIMRAFAGLGDMDPDANLLTTVTPHIAEALVATAIGLLAAIPAVMAYNYFVNRVRRIAAEIDGFSADYLNLIRRSYFSG
ncbi:MAG: biopolymer transport protein TolQ [Myxococcota bacterium]